MRDPRVNPMPGDVTSNGKETFYVTRVEDGTVFYTDTPPVEEMTSTLDAWRESSGLDVVLKTLDGTTRG